MNRRSLLTHTAIGFGALLAGCSGGGSNDLDPAKSTPGGTPTDRSFRVVDSYCRSEPGGATVDFGDGTVTVHGRIEAPNGCYTAELADLDVESGTLTVRVQSVEKDGAACVQCLYAIEYEATASFAGSGPSTVVVQHGGKEVARVGR